MWSTSSEIYPNMIRTGWVSSVTQNLWHTDVVKEKKEQMCGRCLCQKWMTIRKKESNINIQQQQRKQKSNSDEDLCDHAKLFRMSVKKKSDSHNLQFGVNDIFIFGPKSVMNVLFECCGIIRIKTIYAFFFVRIFIFCFYFDSLSGKISVYCIEQKATFIETLAKLSNSV